MVFYIRKFQGIIDGGHLSCKIALHLTDDKSQVMAWCRRATSHYCKQRWPRSMSPCVTRPQLVNSNQRLVYFSMHDDVIKWKHFPRYWTFVRGIHRSPVNSPHRGQWRGALMFSLICARVNGIVNNGEAGDLRRNRVNYDVTLMSTSDTRCYISNVF